MLGDNKTEQSLLTQIMCVNVWGENGLEFQRLWVHQAELFIFHM